MSYHCPARSRDARAINRHLRRGHAVWATWPAAGEAAHRWRVLAARAAHGVLLLRVPHATRWYHTPLAWWVEEAPAPAPPPRLLPRPRPAPAGLDVYLVLTEDTDAPSGYLALGATPTLPAAEALIRAQARPDRCYAVAFTNTASWQAGVLAYNGLGEPLS